MLLPLLVQLHLQLELHHYETHCRRQQLLLSLHQHCAGDGRQSVASHNTLTEGMAHLAATCQLADAVQLTLDDDLQALDSMFEYVLGEQVRHLFIRTKDAYDGYRQ